MINLCKLLALRKKEREKKCTLFGEKDTSSPPPFFPSKDTKYGIITSNCGTFTTLEGIVLKYRACISKLTSEVT